MGEIKVEKEKKVKLAATKIQWAESTHNFWGGCKKVSPGCKFCYMDRLYSRFDRDPREVLRAPDDRFNAPMKDLEPKLIFTCSMSDFFIEEADEWRDDAWSVIKNSPQHTYQILTKRPERIAECLPEDWGKGYPNVWLGVSVEAQAYVSRMEILSGIPAAVRFVSAEPLLEELDLLVKGEDGHRIIDDFDWIIIGGESGFNTGKHRYRPSEIAWYERIVKDLKTETDVAVFVKQMGTYLAYQGYGSTRLENGRLADMHGGDIASFPEALKLREMPL